MKFTAPCSRSVIAAPEEPTAHSSALWLSINPSSMKSQGANVEKRANLPVYTISSYTEALAPALQSREPTPPPTPPPPPPLQTCLQKCSCWTKWLYHLGLLFHLCCCFSWNPFQAVSPPNSGEVWKMEEGNHAKWTYSPACRKITGGWTISHLLLPTELQISHLHKTEGHEKLNRKDDARRK